MSNFFEEIAGDAKGVEEKLLGPTYAYYDKINTPSEMGMSSKGSFSSVSKNIAGLVNYTELLVSGKGGASKTGGPLGPQFFLKTGQQCTTETGDLTDRYLYISHKPTGNIPFISSGLGVDFTEFEGLIPGTFSNLNDLNPIAMFRAFISGSNPVCQPLTMETTPTSTNDNKTSQTEYVTINDISAMDPCIFSISGKTNPINGNKCKEAFQSSPYEIKKDVDMNVTLFYGSMSILGLYLLIKFMEKNGKN
jgi:hypothetical protein